MSKKLLKRAGASAMAAAVVVTGLSFGPAAVAAPASTQPTGAVTPLAATASASGAFVLSGLNGKTWGVAAPRVGSTLDVREYSSVNAAVSSAPVWQFPKLGESGPVRLNDGSNACLHVSQHQDSIITPTRCDGSAGTIFDWVKISSAADSGYTLRSHAAPQSFLTVSGTKLWTTTRSAEALPIARAHLVGEFSAHVSKVDLDRRSATISGNADAGARIIIDDLRTVTADKDGEWTAELSGLKLGSNSVKLEAWVQKDGDENFTKQSEVDLEVNLTITSLTAVSRFASNPKSDATIVGVAQPGATVTAKASDDTVLATTTAHATSGAYTLSLAAPNTAGVRTVTVAQTITGETVPGIKVDLDYGRGITIERPVDDFVHPGGAISFSGEGEVGGAVALREKGKAGVLGTAEVLPNHKWSIPNITLDDAKRTLVATQTAKGNNTTTAEVTLNPDGSTDPGDGDIAKPIVETPAYDSTVTTSRPTFTGTGHKGATVTIGYGANSIIGTATVADGGTWSITPTSGLALGTSTLIVTQTSGKDVQTVEHKVTRVVAEAPLRVTSHTNNQNYAEGLTTFRGTAATGAAIKAVNQWGTVMGTATANENGIWTFNRNLGPTTAGYDITFTATKDGRTETASLHLNFAGAVAFQVTSPADKSTYEIGNAVFRGKASPNTVVTAVNQWGTAMGTATANLNGDWTFTRYLGPTTAGYDITFTAVKGTDTQRSTIHIDQKVTNVPVAITSIDDGDTYTPGMNILRGTGTPGATVSAVNATNNWNVPMGTATVDANGAWALPERNWGPTNDYEIKVTQTNPDKTTSTATVKVKAPVFKDLVVTGSTTGAANGPGGVFATFTGTATPGADITIKSAASDAVYQTVTADGDGKWEATRTWNATHTYNLTFVQKARDGKTDTVQYGNWSATSTR